MTNSLASKETTCQRLTHLKTQQQLCNKLLTDCLSLMEVYPDHSERLIVVINEVKNMMAQNTHLIARLESFA